MDEQMPRPEPERPRAYGAIERVILFGEQLQIAMELLQAGGLARARLALVAVDNLADLLIHRHADRVFDSSEGSWWYARPKFSAEKRERIRKSFARLLMLAQTHADAPFGRHVDPILSPGDAAIFRVAHSYRNEIYHEDRHNLAILAPLVVLYAQAVGRAFALSNPENISWGIGRGQLETLQALGYRGPDRDSLTPTNMYAFEPAAAQIVDHLLGEWEVHFEDFRSHLAEDINHRALSATQTVLMLLDAGMPEDRLSWVFVWSQFWAKHGYDAEWQRLDTQRFELDEALRAEPDSDKQADLAERAHAAHEAYITRAHELQRGFKPTVKWHDGPRFGRLAESLGKARDLASLLTRYEPLDKEVAELERASSRAAETWSTVCDQAHKASREEDWS